MIESKKFQIEYFNIQKQNIQKTPSLGFGEKFFRHLQNCKIKNKSNQKYTNVLWIGIGGSGLGPLLITESLQKFSEGLNFSYIDNIDPFLINEKLIEFRYNQQIQQLIH